MFDKKFEIEQIQISDFFQAGNKKLKLNVKIFTD